MADFQRRTHVVRRIHQLAGADGAHPAMAATAHLAALRRAVSKQPGSVPDIWAITIDGIPEDLPSWRRVREETAVHVALCLFAIHQQSRPQLMHVQGRGFGAAVRQLAEGQRGDQDVHETPVYRRFVATSSATNIQATLTHVRGLVTQLRARELGFDYGAFADDLYRLQDPRSIADVRRRWGRDFHNFSNTPSTEGDLQ